MIVFVGTVLEKNGKYLLVQEGQKSCYKEWSIPGGLLDYNEKIIDGVMREVKEEIGCSVKLSDLCFVGNRVLNNDIVLFVVFRGNLLDENITPDNDEILDAKWVDYDEVLSMKKVLRSPDLVLKCIDNCKNGSLSSLNIIDVVE